MKLIINFEVAIAIFVVTGAGGRKELGRGFERVQPTQSSFIKVFFD
jgi:hypothetical protein